MIRNKQIYFTFIKYEIVKKNILRSSNCSGGPRGLRNCNKIDNIILECMYNLYVTKFFRYKVI